MNGNLASTTVHNETTGAILVEILIVFIFHCRYSQVSDLDRENKKKSMKLEEFEIACTALEDMNEKLKRACEELENEKNYVNAQCNKLLIQVIILIIVYTNYTDYTNYTEYTNYTNYTDHTDYTNWGNFVVNNLDNCAFNHLNWGTKWPTGLVYFIITSF